ncbi:unnamed protein product [Diamesa serratosioi]
MLVSFVLFASIVLALVFLNKTKCIKNNRDDKLNGPGIIEIIKSVYELLFKVESDDRLQVLKRIHKLFPRLTRIKIFSYNFVLVYDAAIMKKIFNSPACMERPFAHLLELDKGLLASKYHEWRSDRKHINLAFNLNILKGFIPIFAHYSKVSLTEMEKNKEGEDFDVLLPLSSVAARTVAATMLNVHGVEVSAYKKLIDSINKFLEILFKRIINPFLHSDAIFKYTKGYQQNKEAREFCYNYGDELIAASRLREKENTNEDDTNIDENGNEIEKTKNEKPKINFIIDQLVSQKGRFTDRELREHIFTLLITASETSANFVATSLVHLAIHQDVQQKLYEEIKNVLYSDELEVDYEAMNSMKYLDMFVKEMLRLSSPIPISARKALDVVDIGEKKPLPKGTVILLLNFVLHRRRDIWGSEADIFNPENFSPEKVAERDPYNFVPFGMGPRGCIGIKYAMFSAKVELIIFIQKIFISPACLERPFAHLLELDKGLLASKYHEWRSDRKHINLAFNLNILKGFIPIFAHYSKVSLTEMEKNKEGEDFDVLLPVTSVAARTVAATMLNVNGVEVSAYKKLIDSINKFLEILFKRIINPFLHSDAIFKYTKGYQQNKEAREFCYNYGDELIAASRLREKENRNEDDTNIDENGNEIEKTKNEKPKINFIIDQLVSQKGRFTDRELREHIFTLLITASETSANFVATSLVHLAIHQDVQQKLYEEIKNVLYSDELEVDYEAMNSMKYLDMFVKEMLRLSSPIPMSIRKALDVVDIGEKKKKATAKGHCYLIIELCTASTKRYLGK